MYRIKDLFRTVLLGGFICFMALPATSIAATLHVGAGLDPSVQGNYTTISDALAAATAGDVVAVGAGVYTENLVGKTDVIVQGAGTNLTRIIGNVYLYGTLRSVEATGVIYVQGDNSRIINVVADSMQRNPSSNSPVTGAYIASSRFENGISHTHLSNTTIVGNEIGISFYLFREGATIIGNRFYGMNNHGWTSRITIPDNTIFQNNLVDRSALPSGVGGVLQNYSVIGQRVENNTFTARPDDTNPITIDTTWKNNIFVTSATPPSIDTNGNLVGDPSFVDAANGNYQLAAGSPGINAGAGLDPDGSAADLGAYGGTGSGVWIRATSGSGQPEVGFVLVQPDPVSPGEPLRLRFNANTN